MTCRSCRCGYVGPEERHPCHRKCGRPGKPRYYCYPTALAGVQMKLGAYETYACDECWNWYINEFLKKEET